MAKCKYCLKELGTDGFCSNCRPGKLLKKLSELKKHIEEEKKAKENNTNS